jgi:hypothetical protein
MASPKRGNRCNARATRIFSRAAPSPIPVRQLNQCAQLRKPTTPATALIELAQHDQQAVVSRVQVRGQLCDLITQALEVRELGSVCLDLRVQFCSCEVHHATHSIHVFATI